MKIKSKVKKILYKASALRESGKTAPVRSCKGFQKIEIAVKDTNSVQPQEDFPLEQTGWLEKNPEALALVKTGIAQAHIGKVKRMSFVECADLEIDD